jgi:RNA polymerase sigma-70 factor (ECF subfamily)
VTADHAERLTTETAQLRATDSELLRRAQHGDDQALHELVDRHAQSLFGLAFSLVGNAADAEDVVQETLLGAFRRLNAFEGRSSVKTWLTRILMRQAARHHRRRHVRRTVSIDRLSDPSADILAGRPAPAGAEQLNVRMDVMEALDTLSPLHREIIVLRELQGLSYAEMAEVLDVPPGTVESRLFRARRELRDRLKSYLT